MLLDPPSVVCLRIAFSLLSIATGVINAHKFMCMLYDAHMHVDAHHSYFKLVLAH